jgi:poly-gamma-glutamate synthesis protein (capsule biosynthesis protein)
MTVLPANSLAVGFVGYTDVVIDSPFYASTDTSGVARFHIETAREQIPKYKKSVDLLVVNLHWGIEYFHLPTPQQIATARELIDLGADIIIGHHPHTLQGIEKYNGGIVAYSLGNFVFADIRWDWMTQQNERRTTYYTLSRNLRESVILRVNVGRNRELDYHLAGTYVAKSGQILPSRRRPVRRMQELSTCLGREDYPSYFENALRRFNRTTLIKRSLARLKRFYKLRPKHLREFGDLIRKST